MKLKAFRLSIALAFLFSVQAASAGFYVSGNLGISSPDNSNFDDALALQLRGGYQFIDYLAVQFGYTNLGTFENKVLSSLEIEVQGAEVSAVGIWPITQTFSAYGRLGMFNWRSSAKGSSSSTSGTDPVIGLGAEFSFTDKLSVYGELNRYDADNADIDHLGVGLKFSF